MAGKQQKAAGSKAGRNKTKCQTYRARGRKGTPSGNRQHNSWVGPKSKPRPAPLTERQAEQLATDTMRADHSARARAARRRDHRGGYVVHVTFAKPEDRGTERRQPVTLS